MGRYNQMSIAVAIERYWDFDTSSPERRREHLRFLIKHGLEDFISDYHSPERSHLLQEEFTETLIELLSRYTWLRDSLDGRDGYDNLDALESRLVKLRKHAEIVAELAEGIEVPYLAGAQTLNLKALSQNSDSQGIHHKEVETFFGSLLPRLCIDATTVAVGLRGLDVRLQRTPGPPPVVSLNWLTMAAFEFYQGAPMKREIVLPKVHEPKSADDYTGEFWVFLLRFTDLIAPEAAPQKKINTGYGSQVGKLYRKFTEDQSLPARLIPSASVPELVLVTNQISSLR